jgi:hypothetical protein
MTEENTSAVALIDKYAVMTTTPADLAEIIAENTGGDGLSEWDLERIKVPAGGGIAWEVETLDGLDTRKALEGVVVGMRNVRSYWASDEMTGAPPDCSSRDGVTGTGAPGGACHECPLAKFGSGKNQSQACKAMRLLFLVQPDTLLPAVVVVPPSSLKAVRKHMLRLAARATRFHAVVTRLELEKCQNADGITYARIVPTSTGRLSEQQAAVMQEYAETMRPAFEAATVPDTPTAAGDEVPF